MDVPEGTASWSLPADERHKLRVGRLCSSDSQPQKEPNLMPDLSINQNLTNDTGPPTDSEEGRLSHLANRITGSFFSSYTEQKRWMYWKYIRGKENTHLPPKPLTPDGNDDYAKVPMSVQQPGHYGSSTNPSTWGTFEEACNAAASDPDADGIGFILNGDGLVCIDPDDTRDPMTGELAGMARDLVTQFRAPTEVSVSGKGLHIWCRGHLPEAFTAGPFEVYGTSRFIALTGDFLADHPATELPDRTSELRTLIVPKTTVGAVFDLNEYVPATNLTDSGVIRRIRASHHRDRFDAYMNGDDSLITGDVSKSGADWNLLTLIADFTDDIEQIDRIFCNSGFADSGKWLTRDGRHYRKQTLRKLAAHKARDWEALRSHASRRATFVPFSDVPPRTRKWLWKPYIPLRKTTHLFGDPGKGKSQITLDLAARVSLGIPMPDGSEGSVTEPAGVLIITTEDDVDDTIVPRPMAIGRGLGKAPDLSRIGSLRMEADEKGIIQVTVPDDVDLIKREAKRIGAKLIVFDPIVQMVQSKSGGNNDMEVRKALAPLKDLAAELECAVIFIQHFNKNANLENILYKGGGSIAWTAFSRSVLCVFELPMDENAPAGSLPTFALASSKMSTAAPPPSQQYHIVGEPNLGIDDEGGQIDAERIEWLGRLDVTAQTLHSGGFGKKESPKVTEMREFFKDLLKNGPVPATTVFEEAKQKGLSDTTLKNSDYKRKIGVRSYLHVDRETGAREWRWDWETVVTVEGNEVR